MDIAIEGMNGHEVGTILYDTQKFSRVNEYKGSAHADFKNTGEKKTQYFKARPNERWYRRKDDPERELLKAK